MSKNIQSIRGMHDFAPEEAESMRMLESKLLSVLKNYAYQEIRTPIVEKLELFKRSIGEVTDIVEKEMYAFEDRAGDWLGLRPEGTASAVRAGIQNGWLYNQQQRYWYLGPFFRRERPQKGRYRQFHQLGVETFGMQGPDVDLELILLSRSMWQSVKLPVENLQLQINTLGDNEARAKYREQLIAYLSDHQNDLDDDARKRMHANPLRVLDSKNPEVQSIVSNAPKLIDYLDEEAKDHFDALRDLLRQMNIEFVVNPTLVRGLDYYNRTVFEWVSTELGAQGTICAGGRYDNLVQQLGGKATYAAGFAVGLERLLSLTEKQLNYALKSVDAYFVALGEDASSYGFQLLAKIREQLPDCAIQMNCGGGSIKAQMKRADRSGARLALIVGEDEVSKQQIAVKHLQTNEPQQVLSENELLQLLKAQN
ncbi:MAG: histidine--tRNA ligase [Gammaproteobacteria bacterium]|nr:histidine--tRNA ligase [Gammaproteobacteria bacterium]